MNLPFSVVSIFSGEPGPQLIILFFAKLVTGKGLLLCNRGIKIPGKKKENVNVSSTFFILNKLVQVPQSIGLLLPARHTACFITTGCNKLMAVIVI